MDNKEGTQAEKMEELPQIDGFCDSCEPDEAQPATHVCHVCNFAFCPVHSEKHASRTHHPLSLYNHEEAQADRLSRDRNVGGEPEDEASTERTADSAISQGNIASVGVDECHGADENRGAQNDLPLAVEQDDGAAGVEPGQEAMAVGGVRSRKTVTVERLRCKEHGEEGSLYCKPDEKIICVVCAVQGEHKGHEIITLREAYAWQKSMLGCDLVNTTREVGENINAKWTSGEMSADELEDYVSEQFEVLRKLVLVEQKRTRHLVDLKEAFLTATAAEKIAEINMETERLEVDLVNITKHLHLLEKADVATASASEVAKALSAPIPKLESLDVRPRLPLPIADPISPQDFEDNDSGPSMDHAP